MISYSIQQIPEEERPRERLARLGAEALSSAELIAVLLGSGTKSQPILQLAQEIVVRFGTLQGIADATINELCAIKGMGVAKAIQLKAAFSLGLRAAKQAIPPKYRVENPIHAYHLIKDEIEREPREVFIAIFLDTKAMVITHEVIAIGTLSRILVHPRELFYPAIRHKAASMIIAHNHPSGDPTPSPEDHELTAKLVQASKLLHISINDHLIVGQGRFISMRQLGFGF